MKFVQNVRCIVLFNFVIVSCCNATVVDAKLSDNSLCLNFHNVDPVEFLASANFFKVYSWEMFRDEFR